MYLTDQTEIDGAAAAAPSNCECFVDDASGDFVFQWTGTTLAEERYDVQFN